MEPARHLSLLINPETGEAREAVCPGCEERETTIEMQGRELNGYRLRLAAKEKELARVQGVAPDAGDVKQVLDRWASRVIEEGWWSRKPAYRPGHPRWSTVSARLQEPEYDIQYCLEVVEGALFSTGRDCRGCGQKLPKREWLDATSIFSAKNIERHYERAQDPYCQRVRKALKLPPAAEKLFGDPALPYLLEECDCGHVRLDHSKGDPARDGTQPCLVHGCWCEDYSDTDRRADEWLKSHGP